MLPFVRFFEDTGPTDWWVKGLGAFKRIRRQGKTLYRSGLIGCRKWQKQAELSYFGTLCNTIWFRVQGFWALGRECVSQWQGFF